ncbi:MAG TPA: hypothetical protein ENI23_02430 [bacterium]|nr:hypothetical protein [bacterium]
MEKWGNDDVKKACINVYSTVGKHLERNENVKAIQALMKFTSFGNKYFDEQEIWRVVKEDPGKAGEIMYNLLNMVNVIREVMQPFLPNAASKLAKILGQEDYAPEVGKDTWGFEQLDVEKLKIKNVEVLFEKLDKEAVLNEKLKSKS